MISDEKLLKISLLTAVIGVAMIYAATSFASQPSLIKDIKEGDAGKQVILNGTIASVNENNGNVFIGLQDGTGDIPVVMFERTARNQQVYELEKNDEIIVKGQVNIYKSELEIIANSITKAG